MNHRTILTHKSGLPKNSYSFQFNCLPGILWGFETWMTWTSPVHSSCRLACHDCRCEGWIPPGPEVELEVQVWNRWSWFRIPSSSGLWDNASLPSCKRKWTNQGPKNLAVGPFAISKNIIFIKIPPSKDHDCSIFSHPKALGVPKLTTISPTVSCLQPVTMMRSDLAINKWWFVWLSLSEFVQGKN